MCWSETRRQGEGVGRYPVPPLRSFDFPALLELGWDRGQTVKAHRSGGRTRLGTHANSRHEQGGREGSVLYKRRFWQLVRHEIPELNVSPGRDDVYGTLTSDRNGMVAWLCMYSVTVNKVKLSEYSP